MAANGTMDPVEKILIAIGMVRDEITGLRADLGGTSELIENLKGQAKIEAAKAEDEEYQKKKARREAEYAAFQKEFRNIIGQQLRGSSTAVEELIPASLPAAAGAPSEFKPAILAGIPLLINMETGRTYLRKEDGSKGEWAGIFKRYPKPYINVSVHEPLEGGKRKSTRKQKRKHRKTRKH